jgi:branched-chain amino acid transport system substrate-binding protein
MLLEQIASRVDFPRISWVLFAAVFSLLAWLSLAQEPPSPIVIGRLVSRSGAFEAESLDVQRGFDMWFEDVKARGGVLMLDGQRHPVEVITYNDASDLQVVRVQTEWLIEKDKVHLLVGPYGGAMTLEMVKVANKTQTPCVCAVGSSSELFESGFKHSFSMLTQIGPRHQICTELFADQFGIQNFEMILDDDSFENASAKTFADYMAEKGVYQLHSGYPLYPVDETEFLPHRQRWEGESTQRPDLVLIGGALPFSIAALRFVRSIWDPKAIYLANSGAMPGLIAEFDWEDDLLFQSNQWEATVQYDDYYYGDTATWAAAFQQRTNTTAYLVSAASYVCGLVIEEAFKKLYSPDNVTNEEINAVIASLDFGSFFGRIRFLSTGEINTQPFCEQVQQGNLIVPVFPGPEEVPGSVPPIYPALPDRPPKPALSDEEVLIIAIVVPVGTALIAAIIVAFILRRKFRMILLDKDMADDSWAAPPNPDS